ncbi:MAG: HAMP domain-containing histidine kinase [Myxococcales bacterium]|nr:HAMP domain-containing histidine kinase [Myxococcales bacterium]
MSVRLKLITIILFVALLPVSISAYTMLSVHQESANRRVSDLHQKTAELGAARSQGYLGNATRVLGSLVRDRIDWASLTESERPQVLWLIYEQLEGVVVVSLLDEEGLGIGPSVYRDASLTAQSLRARPIVSEDYLKGYARSLPHAQALERGQALGTALAPKGKRGAIIPLAFSVAGPNGARWVLGIGLSLTRVCERLANDAPPDTRLELLDSRAMHLCPSAQPKAQVASSLAAILPAQQPSTLRYQAHNGRRLLAAAAPGGADWTVVATQAASTAFAPGRRIRQQLMFWIGFGVLGALVAGFFLAREITSPIATLSQATRQIAAGHYDLKLAEEGRDEFAQLSHAFNVMCAEIQSWNTELTKRVDERTRALSEAQEQLLESKKSAAVISMSAGIAHEINNPLTAVISFAQVLESRAKRDPKRRQDATTLGKLSENALRIHDIVRRMQRLAEDSSSGKLDTRPADVTEAAKIAVRDQLAAAGIDLTIEEEPNLPRIYVHRSQFQHALEQILSNSIKAIDGDIRRITISTKRMGDDLLQFEITDTGRGIPEASLKKIFDPFYTLKEEWRGQGLGLAETRQIIAANHGTVKVRSTVGEGTTMTILMPVATERTHLV